MFLGTTYQNGKIYQNGHKIYQMAFFERHSDIYPNWDFWFENIPSGNRGSVVFVCTIHFKTVFRSYWLTAERNIHRSIYYSQPSTCTYACMYTTSIHSFFVTYKRKQNWHACKCRYLVGTTFSERLLPDLRPVFKTSTLTNKVTGSKIDQSLSTQGVKFAPPA
jgi:hypothetical protein